jgi:hypothetical protein
MMLALWWGATIRAAPRGQYDAAYGLLQRVTAYQMGTDTGGEFVHGDGTRKYV